MQNQWKVLERRLTTRIQKLVARARIFYPTKNIAFEMSKERAIKIKFNLTKTIYK